MFGHSWGTTGRLIRGTNIIIILKSHARMSIENRREVCADKCLVTYIGVSSANITGVKWRIWWVAPAFSACIQMRMMA